MNRKSNSILLWTPGGAISNMYAMLIARFKMFPEVKEKGMAAIPRLVAFTSEHVCVSVFSYPLHLFVLIYDEENIWTGICWQLSSFLLFLHWE